MTRRLAPLVAVAAFALPKTLHAHEGRALAPHDVWSAWTWEPAQVALLAVAAALYALGTRALWRRAGTGAGVTRGEAAAFALGWVALFVALVSPVHAMGEVLLTAHMAQHELLMALAAPLLVLGRPLVPALWAVPQPVRRTAGALSKRPAVSRSWAWLTRPGPATAVHAVALWAWHVPALYSAALRSEALHALQHASFFGTGLLFWWAVLGHRARKANAGVGVFALFVTMLHTGALGALLAVADAPWYPAYIRTAGAWGLTALEDQQLAGLVMWVPAGLSYLVAALWLFACWLSESGRRAEAREGAGARVMEVRG